MAKRAKYFEKNFGILNKKRQALAKNSIREIHKITDEMFYDLDNIWKQGFNGKGYPQNRMVHVLDLIIDTLL